MEMLLYIKLSLLLNLLSLIILDMRLSCVQGSSCGGLICENGGTVISTRESCHCECPTEATGHFCEYKVRESSFPEGPYALPMSKDGCPEGRAQGWGVGYINITTTRSLYDVHSYPNSCQEFVHDVQFTLKPNNPAFRTNIIGPFDQYTVQMNVCFKVSDHDKSASGTWPHGNYGVFGTVKGCPEGLSRHRLTICFLPLLHYNIYGNVPYVDIIDVKDGTELQFIYCRHEEDDAQGNAPLGNTNPYMIIKDPELKEHAHGCPNIPGYEIIDERFPGPMPATIQGLNTTYPGTTYAHFPFCYCHVIPKHHRRLESWPPSIHSKLFHKNGFPGSAFPLIDVMVEMAETEGCLNMTGLPFNDHCERVEAWVMIDVRRAVPVSAVMITSSEQQRVNVYLTKIFIANQRWSFLNDGASVCMDNGQESGSIVNIFVCNKPHTGRFVTLVTRPYNTSAADIWDYSKTYITILSYNSTEVYTMEKRYKGHPYFGDITRDIAYVIEYTDIDSKECRQELGMQDFGIWDTQLTSSSWQHLHEPKHARPQFSGWCAANADVNPYIQIDFVHLTSVDGIVLINWYKFIDIHNNNIYKRDMVAMGSYSFHLSYGFDLGKLHRTREYTYDTSRKLGEPQTFIFSDSFLAKYIRIYPTPFLGTNDTCMKFELLGCRNSDSISFDCENSSSREISHMQSIFVPTNEEATIYADLSSFECEARCLHNETNCISTHYKADGLCLLYNNDNTQSYINVAAHDSRDILSMVTCLIDQEMRDSTFNINSSWSTYKETTITEFGFLSSIGYPLTYTYNSVFRWKIELPEKNVILQFMEISLRTFEASSKVSKCQDTIIIGEYTDGPIWNPFLDVDDNDTMVHHTINSTFTDRTPAFSIGGFNSYTSFYITFFSCSAGNVLTPGRGFRLHLSGPELPLCFKSEEYFLCIFPQMEVISQRFLGQTITQTLEPQFWAIFAGRGFYSTRYKFDSLLMTFEFEDFDISCHSESLFEISDVSGENHHVYCNDNRPYGKQLAFSMFISITYRPNRLQSAVETVFPEGFQLSYRCIPTKESLPYDLSIKAALPVNVDTNDTDDSTYHACIHALQKCYTIKTVQSYSWVEAETMCLKSNSSMVKIKTVEEMSIIRSVLIHHYAYTYRATITLKLFIGLRRYIDSTGVKHEHWTDGTPLTFTAWDKNEPSDTILNLCTIMGLHQPSDNGTWKTQSCTLKQLASDIETIAMCEHPMRDTNTTLPELSLATNDNNDFFMEQRDPATMFKCSSGEWTSSLSKCNGIRECFDSSDEASCERPDGGNCTKEEFTCPDDRCIHVSKLCDFVEDCEDAADEFCKFPSCTTEQFKCSSGQCIRSDERCNSIKNCVDATDEINCDSCALKTAFQCGDKSCISARLVCDMHVDCPDGADEMSCDRKYTTCDDLWRDGITNDGYFKIEQSYYIYCDFDYFGKYGGWIRMQYLNTDWKQLASNIFRIETAGIRNALDNGYTCSQKFSSLPHRERLRVMELDNKTFTVDEREYKMSDSYTEIEKPPFLVDKDFKDQKFVSFILETYLNTLEERMQLGKVECDKYISANDPLGKKTLFCRKGVKSTDQSQRCLYSKDENGVIDGCRSLAHLQNCESFTCPDDYVKCPDSFCIPFLYVCNGRIDCQDGFDEKLCACENQPRKIVIMAPVSKDGMNFHEIAARLGGQLFTEKSTVKVFTYEQITSNFLEFGKRSTRPIMKLRISDTLSNSEHYSIPFKVDDLSKEDIEHFLKEFYGTQSDQATNGLIWLTDEHIQSYSENVTASQLDNLEKNASIKVFRYHVVIDKNAKTAFFHTNMGNFKELNVRNVDILGTIGAQFFPEICKGKSLPCNGMYRCLFSKVCLPLSEVCDSRAQCPYGDDEDNCNFKCPKGCYCGPQIIKCSNIRNAKVTLSDSSLARVLDISNSKDICKDLLEQQTTRQSFKLLISLNMSGCKIKVLSRYSFDSLHNLKTLDLTFNKFAILPRDVFHNLEILNDLRLTGNHHLIEIEPGAFTGISINILTISYTKIHTLLADTFKGLHLDYLELTFNEISSIQDLTFNSLESRTIDIRENPISTFTSKMFAGVIDVINLKTPAYKFCCIRHSMVNEEDCLPHKDEFSSCEDLMRNGTLQALMWIIGFLALIGNVLSIVYRLLYDKKRMKLGYGIFVTNLAIADLFMGIYMLIIAVADKVFRNRYIEVDEYWRNSVWCKLAGVLSTVSSEGSVLFMCLITIDRILVIKYPFGQLRFNVKSATLAVMATWLFVIIISLFPVLYTEYFEGKFYSKSAVCLALPLTRERPPGWLYSILLFIGFNMVTFILIAIGQLLIYAEIKKHASVKKSFNITRSNDLKVARNLLLVVTTDFLCWFPIGMMGALALAGETIPGEVYAWTAVIILPINSAINPFMYTLTAIFSRQKFSPSVDEQSRTDMSKEMGKTVMKIYPYVPTHKHKKNSTIFSLRDVMENRGLTPHETVHLAFRVISFIGILHEYDLVLKRITENDIFISVFDNGQIQRKLQIDVQAYPNTTTKKNVRADDIYSFGCLLERILSKQSIITTNYQSTDR